MREMRIFVALVLAACGSEKVGSDASTDATNDANEAAAEATPPCKTGLSDAGTDAVVCGATSCSPSDVCCIGADASCVAPSGCGNLELVWACDRSAHCGSGRTCCYSLLMSDFTTCPGGTLTTAPTCETAPSASCSVVCQTDTDCDAGQTCYAMSAQSAGRTFGVCR